MVAMSCVITSYSIHYTKLDADGVSIAIEARFGDVDADRLW
ncbi:hypothetical protein SFOMI_3942 [Sphingobium fuliginis]|uniref:Uncharacterized protein n=1 Tax=Sphingobium fuliginis (strain ATCC 27551) TaxID=336203 RepID=A0A292ZKB2_SPHSA|nr:hypothetical protein SFOMI_3942 [Sphingobium fuliginis]